MNLEKERMHKKSLMVREMNNVMPKKLKSSFFGGFVMRPKKTIFGTQNEGERIFVLIRQHWIVNIGWIIRCSIYLVIPIMLYFLLPLFVQIIGISFAQVPLQVWIIIILGYYSVMVSLIFMNFVDWYFDIFIVTNERILDLEFNPFEGYNLIEAALENIQDVREESKDFLGTLFNYGDVKAKTSSDKGILMLEKVPNPTKVRDIISDLASIARKYNN